MQYAQARTENQISAINNTNISSYNSTNPRLTSVTNTEATFSSASDRWATPSEPYAALNAEFNFDFDPCPLDGDGDGLAPLFCSWKGKRAFVSPRTAAGWLNGSNVAPRRT